MELSPLGDIGLFMLGLGALIAGANYWRAVTKRWAYREWRRDLEMRLARLDARTRLIGRVARRHGGEAVGAAYRESLDRLDELEIRMRAHEGPEPGPPAISIPEPKA